MKPTALFVVVLNLLITPHLAFTQDKAIRPSFIGTGQYLGETPALRDLPTLTESEWRRLEEKGDEENNNPELDQRSYPYASTAFPKGVDPVWQDHMVSSRETRAPILNFDGLDSPYYPPDANGSVGPDHYMQVVNTVYTIYDKQGNLLAGPTAINTLFSGVNGSEYNDGDPVVLYDDQAGRWLVCEFSISGSNDYMLAAVSTTSDPTGTWYKYSFDVADMPDYPKFGIWRDGYYMGTNNSVGNDIYVFERSQMLIGEPAQMVGFNNPWRPTTMDGFMCVPPLDNDGDFAPEGSPGLFITINDDAIAGGTDQLWIYALDVDWTTPSNSTFTRTQQINVAAFDSNFGSTWDNIQQQGTTKKLDAIPMVIMNPPQYRNFGTYESIVCCHTVDVDNTNHAGIRWYELRRTDGGSWTIRQQGTYAPDGHSRWMGSIMLNGQNQIGLAYSISSSTLYPGIRYCGQSPDAYMAANGMMDVAEDVIQDGAYAQSGTNRWGDYSALQVDPSGDSVFWYTSEYIGNGGTRKTKIANFVLGPAVLDANFTVSNTTPKPGATVAFTDLSTGTPSSWNWTFDPATVNFVSGTTAQSQNPLVKFVHSGYYTVTLTVTNDTASNTETRTNYIHAFNPGLWTGESSEIWSTTSNWDGLYLPNNTTPVTIPAEASHWPTYTGNFTVGDNCSNLVFEPASQMVIFGNLTINSGDTLNMTAGGTLKLTGNLTINGSFLPGTGTVEFIGNTNTTVTVAKCTGNISTYSRSTFPKGMTPLSDGNTGPSGDDGFLDVNLGFTFNYSGTDYTALRISTNGWISLNKTGYPGYTNNDLFLPSQPNTTITAWWDDLNDDATSVIYYKTTGTAPNRVFTVEWNRILTYYTGSTARISYQVKLYETTDVIEFHYGSLESGAHSSYESASIGAEDATGGSGHFIEATTGSTTSGVTSLSSVVNWPTINYRFTPVFLDQNFNNIVVNNQGGVVSFTTDTDINGLLNVLPGAAVKIKNNAVMKIGTTGN